MEIIVYKSLQPLSYQQHETSCWVTSVMNGLLVLYKSKNKIPTLAYRLLHAILTNDGVLSSGKHRDEWKIVMSAVGQVTDLDVAMHFGQDVEKAISNLQFNNQVAICDTESGVHSVLLSGRNGNTLEGFDPDWDNIVGGDEKPERYWTYPSGERGAQSWINFRVEVEHFTSVTRGMSTALRMGPVSGRTLIVISRR